MVVVVVVVVAIVVVAGGDVGVGRVAVCCGGSGGCRNSSGI